MNFGSRHLDLKGSSTVVLKQFFRRTYQNNFAFEKFALAVGGFPKVGRENIANRKNREDGAGRSREPKSSERWQGTTSVQSCHFCDHARIQRLNNEVCRPI